MKTVITEKIDGYDIIKGFGDPQIEPVETRKKVEEKMKVQPELKEVERKAEEMKRLWKLRHESKDAAKIAYAAEDIKNHAKFVYEVEMRDEQIKTLNLELVELLKKLEEKRQEIWKQNLEYFQPKKGEYFISDDEYKQLGKLAMDAKSKRGNLIDKNGNEVIDNRGVKYIKEGKVIEIKELGKKVDGPLISEVSPEEFQRMRYSYTSLEDIEKEKQGKINSVMSYALQMRGELEIKGDSEALKKSQDLYKAEVEKIELEYLQILEDRSADVEARN